MLEGDKSAGGKVLKSGQESNVFLYYADHGAPHLVQMPGKEEIHADELHEALKRMHENKLYKDMVIYLEACESGSMF